MILPITVASYGDLTFEFFPQTGHYLVSRIINNRYEEIDHIALSEAAVALGILGSWQPAPNDCFGRFMHVKTNP